MSRTARIIMFSSITLVAGNFDRLLALSDVPPSELVLHLFISLVAGLLANYVAEIGIKKSRREQADNNSITPK